jgi:hypothetical protein
MKGGDSCIKYQTHILVVLYQFPLKLMPRFTSCPHQAVALTSHWGIFILKSTSAPLPKQTHSGFLPFTNLEDSVNACSPLNNGTGVRKVLDGSSCRSRYKNQLQKVENNTQHGLRLCPSSFITSCSHNIEVWQHLP